jgi:uncharacterized protein YpiB (UPF0302 family)
VGWFGGQNEFRNGKWVLNYLVAELDLIQKIQNSFESKPKFELS